MSKLNRLIKTQLYKIVVWQLFLIMGFALVLFLFQGLHQGFSALCGALTYWLPTFIFLRRVSFYAGAQAAMRFVLAFFTGEALKLFLTGLFFMLLAKYSSIDLLYAVLGLISSIVAFWVVSISTVFAKRVHS